jgi:hypothetical protein
MFEKFKATIRKLTQLTWAGNSNETMPAFLFEC